MTIFGRILLPENVYRVSLEAFNEGASLGKSYIDIQTAPLPTHGILGYYTTPSGAYNEIMALVAEGWTDTPANTPLSYRFGLGYNQSIPTSQCSNKSRTDGDTDTMKIQWISGFSQKSSLETISPFQYIYCSEQISIILEVANTHGAIARKTVRVSDVTPPANLTRGVADVLEEFKSDVTEGGERWKESLAGIAVVLTTLDLNCSFPSLDIAAAKDVATDTLLSIYEHHLPYTLSHLTLFLSLLHRATLPPHSSSLSAKATTSAVRGAAAMLPSLSRTDTPENSALTLEQSADTTVTVLDTLLSLILMHNTRTEWGQIQENSLTFDLWSSVPILGDNLCQRLSVGDSVLVPLMEGGRLKVSHSLLPSNFSAGKLCGDDCSDDSVDVVISFSHELFWSYFYWSCDSGEDKSTNHMSGLGEHSYCSGLCVVALVVNFDLHWQGSPFARHIVSPVLTLSLLHPLTGHPVTTTPPHSSPLTLTFPSPSPPPRNSRPSCAAWNRDTLEWNVDVCTTATVSSIISSLA